jgi:hypothetical protein
MSKINDNLDPNKEAHKIVLEINKENEEKYGPYHEECGHFQSFCTCKKYSPGKSYKVETKNIRTIDDIKLILEFMNLYFTPPTRDSYEKIKHLLKEKKNASLEINNGH